MYVIKIVTDKTLIKKRYPKRLPGPPSLIFIRAYDSIRFRAHDET